jgi:hypothetical protein
MALTITNHLVRSADAPHTAGFGDGAGIVIRLPGGVLTGGPGRRHRGRRGGQPDPGRLQPGGVRRRVLVPLGRLRRPVRPYQTRWHCAGIRGARARVMAWPAAGYGVLAAGDLRGEEDEQA